MSYELVDEHKFPIHHDRLFRLYFDVNNGVKLLWAILYIYVCRLCYLVIFASLFEICYITYLFCNSSTLL